MRTLFLGDIVGRAGRDAVLEFVPRARQALALDFVIVNGENAAGGFGITDDICHQLFAAGVDVITGGNHSWDQSAIIPFIEQEPRLLRPLNHVPGTPGRGCGIFTSRSGQKVLVINALGQVFMDPIDNPFLAIDGELKKVQLGATVQCVVVDFHAEATSEKMAMGHYLDGRVTAVVGSRPGADRRCPIAAQWNRLPERRRHVWRLQLGDRCRQGGADRALSREGPARAHGAGERAGHRVRRFRSVGRRHRQGDVRRTAPRWWTAQTRLAGTAVGAANSPYWLASDRGNRGNFWRKPQYLV